MKIPTDASPSVQQAFRQLWAEIYNVTGRDVDLQGRRVVNAGTGLSGHDYVTKTQLREYVRSAQFAQDARTVIIQSDGGGGGSFGTHQILSPTHSDTSAAAGARGDIMVVNSASLWSRLAKGSAGHVLTSDGTDVSYSAHSLLSASHGDTLAATVVRGDIIVGNSTPAWSRLAKGSSGQIIISDGTDPAWGTSLATLTFTTSRVLSGGNGATWTEGFSSESITIDAVTEDSVANLLPADSVIDAVVARVTTAVTVDSAPATWDLGDPTTSTRFESGISGSVNTTVVGLDHWNPTVGTDGAGPRQPAAAKIRLSVGALGTTYAGVIRVVVFWRTYVAPTS